MLINFIFVLLVLLMLVGQCCCSQYYYWNDANSLQSVVNLVGTMLGSPPLPRLSLCIKAMPTITAQ